MKKQLCDLKSANRSAFKMPFALVFLFSILFNINAQAQIYAPEGVNLPGDWNGWTNYPAVGPFLSDVHGGSFNLITAGTRRYSTTFQATNTTNGFKFTSGPSGNPYGNAWGNPTVAMNTLQTYNVGGGNANATLVNGKWYTVNFKDNGYLDTEAIFMETTSAPITISSVAQLPIAGSVNPSDIVAVTASLSAAPSTEEKVYLRYSIDGFTTSTIVAMTVGGTSASANIPAQVAATGVSYYVFTSTVVAPSTANADMMTIRWNNNGGSNYNYTVNAISNWNVTFRVNMQNETVGGSIYLAGSFNGYSTSADPMTETAPGSGIYEITKSFAQGLAIQYKYVNGASFENNLGAPCGNGSNRTHTVGTADQTLSTVCFSSCNNCVAPVNITFQVNMSNETVGGSVNVSGSFNGWSSSAMTNMGSGIYAYTAAIVPGTAIEYKFVNGASYEGNQGAPCGNGSNRTYTVPGTAASIPVTCFNSCTDCIASSTWTSVTSGNWNTATTWDQGTVPGVSGDVVIASGHSVTYNTSINIKSLTVNAGGTFIGSDGSARTLTIDASGSVSNNGTFNATATSKLVFGNSTTTNGNLTLNDLELNGGLTIAGSLTANGILQLNNGGYFAGVVSPSYGPSSTLKYSAGGGYGRGLEWNATSGVGYPRNVQISNGTLLQPGGNSGQNIARSIAGNLTIDASSAMYMDWGGLEMTQSITIGGSLILNGSLSLSSQSGGDLNVKGNFTMNTGSTFSANGRSVAFNGTAAQAINGTALSVSFAYMNVSTSALTSSLPLVVVNDLSVASGSFTSNADLTLQNGGTLNASLIIASGRSLYVTGGTLTTNGNLTMNSGAALMHGVGTTGGGGAVSGAARIKRTGKSTPAFNFWSSPVSGANAAIIGTQRYSYNPNLGTQSTADDSNEPGWVAASGAMNAGQGYASSAGGTVNFVGNVNNGAIANPVISAALPNSKFNLVGNPYPSAISANAFLATNGPSGSNTITGSIYFWDDDNSGGSDYAISDYAVWNGAGSVGGGGNTPNGNIGSGQGFFVEANASSNVNFTNAMRTNSNSQFFENESIRRVKLNLTNAHNESNETLIAFLNDATEGYDSNYDATKLMGNPNISFYSKLNDDALAIQGLPLSENNRVVELGVIANRNETHTIALSSLELIPSTTMIYLEDRETGSFINLRSQASYAFEIGTMELANRFAIHFSAPVQVTGVAATCDVNAGSIQVSNPSSEAVTYSIAKASELVATATSTNESFSFDNLSEGVYQVSMVFNGGYSTTVQTEITGAIQTNVSIISAASTYYAGDFASFEANSNGTISWFLNDMNQPIGQGSTIEIPFEQAGIYTLIARAENGPCSSTTSIEIAVRADVATGIAQLNASEIAIAPNPAKETTTIRFNGAVQGEKATIQLIDLTGKVVMTEQTILNSGSFTLSLNGIDAGIYMLNINSNSVHSASKLVVQ
jgi:hypothetical protein